LPLVVRAPEDRGVGEKVRPEDPLREAILRACLGRQELRHQEVAREDDGRHARLLEPGDDRPRILLSAVGVQRERDVRGQLDAPVRQSVAPSSPPPPKTSTATPIRATTATIGP
jgi:hypothetical protein